MNRIMLGVSWIGLLTKEDVLFIISLMITVLTLILEYMEYKKKD